MKIKTSMKLFLTALIFYAVSLICYLYANEIYKKQLEQLKKSVFYESISLHIKPEINSWYYAASTTFCVAIAITVAGIWQRKRG